MWDRDQRTRAASSHAPISLRVGSASALVLGLAQISDRHPGESAPAAPEAGPLPEASVVHLMEYDP